MNSFCDALQLSGRATKLKTQVWPSWEFNKSLSKNHISDFLSMEFFYISCNKNSQWNILSNMRGHKVGIHSRHNDDYNNNKLILRFLTYSGQKRIKI